MARTRSLSLKVRTQAFQAWDAEFKSRRDHYGARSPSGRAKTMQALLDCGFAGCEFESRRAPYAVLAQLVQHRS